MSLRSESPVNQDCVDNLVDSIGQVGQLHPITVTSNGERFVLLAGLHRLQAIKQLAYKMIAANVVAADDRQAEIIQIVENLHTNPLTKEERDKHIVRLAELIKAGEAGDTERLSSLADGRSAGPQHQKGTAAKVASITGVHKKTVQRALAKHKPKVPKARKVLDEPQELREPPQVSEGPQEPPQVSEGPQVPKDAPENAPSPLREELAAVPVNDYIAAGIAHYGREEFASAYEIIMREAA